MMVRTEYQSLQIGQARELGVDLKRSPDDVTHRGGKGCARSIFGYVARGQVPVLEAAPSLPNGLPLASQWQGEQYGL